MLSAEGNFESSFWKERDIETKLERGKVKEMIFFYYRRQIKSKIKINSFNTKRIEHNKKRTSLFQRMSGKRKKSTLSQSSVSGSDMSDSGELSSKRHPHLQNSDN